MNLKDISRSSSKGNIFNDVNLEAIKLEEAITDLVQFVKDNENENIKHHKVKLIEFGDICNEFMMAIKYTKRKKKSAEDWNRYANLYTYPESENMAQVNTYIGIVRDTKYEESFGTLLEKLSSIIALRKTIEKNLKNNDYSEFKFTEFTEIKDKLENLVYFKLDEITQTELSNANDNIDTETLNYRESFKSKYIDVDMWGNIAHNLRLKWINFNMEKTLKIKIPPYILVNSYAIRCIFWKMDLLSEHCEYSKFKVKKPTAEKSSLVTVLEEDMNETTSQNSENVSKDSLTKKIDKIGINAENCTNVSVKILKINSDNVMNDAIDKKELDVSSEETWSEYEDQNSTDDYEEFMGQDHIIDLRAYSIVDKIFQLDLIQLPDIKRSVGKWQMREVVEGTVKYVSYSAENKVKTNSSRKNSKRSSDSMNDDTGNYKKSRIIIQYSFSNDVCIYQEPLVAYWSVKDKNWSTNDINIMSFNEDEKIITFDVSKFGIYAFFQDSIMNMPYQYWDIRPLDVNHCKLTITAAITVLHIEIKDGMCKYLDNENDTELMHLNNVWLKPKKFIKALKKAGINIFPKCDSKKYVDTQNKKRKLETFVYKQLALCSTAYAFAWTKWNSKINNSKNHIVIKMIEHCANEPVAEDDWQFYMFTNRSVTKILANEYEDELIFLKENEQLSYPSLYELAKKELKFETTKSRLESVDKKHYNCMLTLLDSIKMINFS